MPAKPKRPTLYLIGAAAVASVGFVLTAFSRATDLYELGWVGGLFLLVAALPLGYATVLWRGNDTGPRFAASLAATVVLFAVGFAFGLQATQEKEETEAGRCADPAANLPQADPLAERQPVEGTVCLNERSTVRFDGGELLVALGDISEEAVISRVTMRANAARPGVTVKVFCPFAMVVTGEVLGFEYNQKEIGYFSWELGIEQVRDGSAEAWLELQEQDETITGLPEEPLHCSKR